MSRFVLKTFCKTRQGILVLYYLFESLTPHWRQRTSSQRRCCLTLPSSLQPACWPACWPVQQPPHSSFCFASSPGQKPPLPSPPLSLPPIQFPKPTLHCSSFHSVLLPPPHLSLSDPHTLNAPHCPSPPPVLPAHRHSLPPHFHPHHHSPHHYTPPCTPPFPHTHSSHCPPLTPQQYPLLVLLQRVPPPPPRVPPPQQRVPPQQPRVPPPQQRVPPPQQRVPPPQPRVPPQRQRVPPQQPRVPPLH
ncbi:pollen-specific leucine-rich repeat extensin-like protein 3 [Xiphophorus hellerii]|uniref:pollen-specific leucine-rich repeat extensin-like protein 3 n=1 Tax=Xiphophorus hellerii TaxID=8084 RepID=UPI0013B36359|nr:pollen-specific leucine-rich repeat extensin-like protein 3 [Xiphophorus hellerii]